MKNQAFFSWKDKSKKLKCRLLQVLFGALRMKADGYSFMLSFSAIYAKGNNFSDFLFVSLDDEIFQKGCTLGEKNLLLELTSIENGGKNVMAEFLFHICSQYFVVIFVPLEIQILSILFLSVIRLLKRLAMDCF